MTAPESPELLAARAADLEREAFAADLVPSRLRLEAARARALAAVMRRRDVAMVALAVAEAAADAAGREYAATEGPEREAADRALSARHVFESAWDTEREAMTRRAELVAAKMRATIAAEVAEHEAAAAAEVTEARATARRARDAARQRVRTAKAAAAAAEAAIDEPLAAEIDDGARMAALFWSWPVRTLLDLSDDPEYKLTRADRQVCAGYAALWAELLNVGPDTVRRQGRAEAAKAYRAVQVIGPGGTATSLSSMLGGT